MWTMIFKMLVITGIYLLLSLILWKIYSNRKITIPAKIIIGICFGTISVLSTHFGVDYGEMVLNIRDVGPLSAGVFFDPVSGIIAGLIGGIERFIAGTYWGVGVYTTLACSISTIFAGLLSAFLHIFVFRRRRPFAFSSFFVGAVMEVFHMYAVFITHQEDINKAFYVVWNCAIPMIVFSGLALALFSIVIRLADREKLDAFRVKAKSETPIIRRFQIGLLVVTSIILIASFLFSYTMQTRQAVQNAGDLLSKSATSISQNYTEVKKMEAKIIEMAEISTQSAADLAALAVYEDTESDEIVIDDNFAKGLRDSFDLIAVAIMNDDGTLVASAGKTMTNMADYGEVMAGNMESEVVWPTEKRLAIGEKTEAGLVIVELSIWQYEASVGFIGVAASLSNFQIGSEGFYDIITNSGMIAYGKHAGNYLTEVTMNEIRSIKDDEVFETKLFGTTAYGWKKTMINADILVTMLTEDEVYLDRDAQAYQTGLSDILLFAVIYAALFMLVQYHVVKNLKKVNQSLGKITDGNLNEVVDVRTSSEFNTLSDDINTTVDALKGYIEAAENRYEQELELARAIQEAALPRTFCFPGADFDLFASMNPAKLVGGDFYDFFFVARDKLALVVADVSGKGIPAALFMMRSKTIIQGFARSGYSPSEILYRANNALCEGNDAEMFVTVWIGMIDLNTGRMSCANAGHEYPVLMRSGEDYQLYKDPHGLVLAAMEGMKFKEYEIQMNPGDKLFTYTDGIPEAINTDDVQYGTDRLVEVLNTMKDLSEEEMLPKVLEDIYEFAGETDQFDDITMLGFTYFGPESKNDK